ncbi:proteoglycan 4-like isoform X2 [Carassius auratus]|uniref:Proteoglycan 4-like isoform X2 n=1 Tax=Carassius auratus TaxID=7957 RepID=A0A6P6QNZ0_CARAU|nr:proteoglycan 4-like isoform X2 [Carassius auratus]
MSKAGERQSVLRTTKVRTALKGDNSWIQRREQENLEREEEEEKPWIAEVRAKRSSGVFEETSTVSLPTANEPQPRPDTDKPKTPASGYLIRGVFTKTESKPTSTSSTNGYAGINSFNKKPSESYKKIAPHTVRSSSEKTAPFEPTLSPEEMEKRTETANTVLKGSQANRRSYVMSAAKKYGSTEKPDSSADMNTSSFAAKRVVIGNDDDTKASVKSVPVQSVKSNTEPVVKEDKPAAPETKTASETKTTIEPKPTIDSKPALGTKPVTETKPTTQTKITTESNATSESKPVLENATQPKTTSEPKPASQPKPATETTTTTEPKPVAQTKPTTQTTTTTEPKPTSEPKPVETKPVTTEFKPAIETKTATETKKVETKTETKPTTQTTTATDPKPTAEPKPVETKPTTQTTVASDPKPTSVIKPVETKTATETKTVETKTFTQTITATDPKPTPEPKPVETKPTATTEPKPVETKPTAQTTTATDPKLVAETKPTTQTTVASDPKPTPVIKPVETKPITTEPKPAETKPATESKSVETKTSTKTITATDLKPKPEPKPVETKTEPEAKSQPKPAPESKSEPAPEKSLSDTLISFSTESASSGQTDLGVDLLSQDLLTDSSSLPQTKKTHTTLDLLADDLIPFSATSTSLVDEFDPIAASSEPTKSPHWYGPPKLDSRSTDTFNQFQHPVDLVADLPPDVSFSLAEDVTPIDPKSDWETNMESYKTSIKTVQSSVPEKLPESDSKKGFVYVKEYVDNSCLDGSSSDYVSSTTSNYNYSSPSYYTRELTTCTYCGEMVGSDAKITIEHLNISCHPSCFKCGICSKPMGDLLYNMFLHRGTVHCESCYSNVL